MCLYTWCLHASSFPPSLLPVLPPSLFSPPSPPLLLVCLVACIPACRCACIPAYVPTYGTYLHTYMHTYLPTCLHTFTLASSLNPCKLRVTHLVVSPSWFRCSHNRSVRELHAAAPHCTEPTHWTMLLSTTTYTTVLVDLDQFQRLGTSGASARRLHASHTSYYIPRVRLSCSALALYRVYQMSASRLFLFTW